MKEKQGIQALELGFEVLYVFVNQKKLTLNEISKLSGYHKSQLYRYINSFEKMKMLIKEDHKTSPTWSLGPELIFLGEAAFNSFNATNIAKPYLLELKNDFNETVALSMWRNGKPYYIRWEKSNNVINIDLSNRNVPLYTATGKIFKAFLPKEITDPIFYKEIAEAQLVSDRIDEEIEDVRKTHVSRSSDRINKGVSAISIPVFNSNGKLAVALSVIGFQDSFDNRVDGPIALRMKEVAEEISNKLQVDRH